MTAGAVDVLVVGAGPSGLFAALELARHGVSARVIERDPKPHGQARATALQPGTLEILAGAGILDDVLASSEHLTFARVLDSGLEVVGQLAFAGAGCPWEYQCSLPQWRTEEILTARLTELGGTVDRGVAAVALEQHDDGVQVRLQHADGRLESADARWVVGAGGAHSLTRASMAEELTGATYPGTALVADVRLRCPVPRDASTLIATPDGYVLLAPLLGERWITFVGDLHEDEIERVDSNPGLDVVAATIARRLGDAVAVEDVAWAAGFRMHHRLVSHLADGRCFLLGDAGHLSSPFGGEGLNSGIWDAHNLAWKLALEIRGCARPAVLASYDTERLAAARHVLEVSDRLHSIARGAVEAQRAGTRAAPPSAEQVAALVRARSMLDVSYAGSPLVGEHLGGSDPPSGPGPGDRYPDRSTLRGTQHHVLLFGPADDAGAARLRARWEALVEVRRAHTDRGRAGLPGDGAVLVRPDGHIGFRAARADASGLDALDRHLGTYLAG